MVDERVDVLRVRTPEGVSFAFALASPVTRLAAWVIDKAVVTAAWSAISAILALLGLLSADLARGIIAVGYFVFSTGYGMAQRKLGTVSVIGPVRMDYACAIATVRDAATELSRFVEDTYAEN